jgi:nitroreductase
MADGGWSLPLTFHSQDHKEAVAALGEKQPPKFIRSFPRSAWERQLRRSASPSREHASLRFTAHACVLAGPVRSCSIGRGASGRAFPRRAWERVLIEHMTTFQMDLFEALNTTRSVRRFTDASVTDDEIMTCVRAAVQAPSGGNIQPWQFIVVTDAETKRALGDVYRRAYHRYEPALVRALPPFRSDEHKASFERMTRAARHLAEHLGEVPVLVLVLMPNISMTLQDDEGRLDVGTPFASVYPAVQNFMLAARGLGIGTTLTTVYRIFHNEVRTICAIPDRYEVVALIPMGRPQKPFVVGRRRPAEQVTHWNRFGAKTRGG